MQECPRCGFMQPKDRFCANCGLDIEKYNPAPPPLLKQVVKSTWLPMSLIVLLIGTLIFTILYFKSNYTKKSEEEIIAMQSYSLEEEISPESSEASSKPDKLEPEPIKTETMMAETDKKEAPKNEKQEAPPLKYNSINVQFGLLEIEKLEVITSTAVLIDQSGLAQVFTIKNKSAITDFIALHTYKTSIETTNEAKVYLNLVEVPGTDTNLGFMMRFAFGNKTDSTVPLRAQTQLIIRDKEKLQDPKLSEHDFSLQLNPDTSILIIGVLPQENIPEGDLENFDSGFISLYQEPAFINKTAESVILLDLTE